MGFGTDRFDDITTVRSHFASGESPAAYESAALGSLDVAVALTTLFHAAWGKAAGVGL